MKNDRDFTAEELPDMLRSAVENFMVEATGAMDPLEALKVTNLTLELVDMAYKMGHHDGQRSSDQWKTF
jgi:hypothetical protein